ncbi:unnamed protein product, partial [Amoebophrya sp. A25]
NVNKTGDSASALGLSGPGVLKTPELNKGGQDQESGFLFEAASSKNTDNKETINIIGARGGGGGAKMS